MKTENQKPIAKVTARAFERTSGKPTCESRTETIYEGNSLFKFSRTPLEIKQVYESFWNELNPESKQIVLVSEVELINP